MAIRASYSKSIFQFSFAARTSRGAMREKESWFIKTWETQRPEINGIGECGPLQGLSPDAVPEFETVLSSVVTKINEGNFTPPELLTAVRMFVPAGFPSLVFGLETALLDLIQGGQRILFRNNFVEGRSIPINGLIWMGDVQFMLNQVHEKIAQGFNCLKLKIGGLDFDAECNVLARIRKQFKNDDIVIRLDANGSFLWNEAGTRLTALAQFDIHSIEQPIKPGLPEMAELCRTSPIPIALDEELIGIEDRVDKIALLSRLNPAYIVLKPTLHGGISGCEEWITLAKQHSIAWWITSALESNIGLNAICQLTANYDIAIPQGLGTGMIYSNNIPSPLKINHGHILLDTQQSWDLHSI